MGRIFWDIEMNLMGLDGLLGKVRNSPFQEAKSGWYRREAHNEWLGSRKSSSHDQTVL